MLTSINHLTKKYILHSQVSLELSIIPKHICKVPFFAFSLLFCEPDSSSAWLLMKYVFSYEKCSLFGFSFPQKQKMREDTKTNVVCNFLPSFIFIYVNACLTMWKLLIMLWPLYAHTYVKSRNFIQPWKK